MTIFFQGGGDCASTIANLRALADDLLAAVEIVAAVLFIVSAWGSGIATSSLEFIIYRILGGLAVGAASVMAPAYISEVAPARYRGRLATIQQVAIIAGLTAALASSPRSKVMCVPRSLRAAMVPRTRLSSPGRNPTTNTMATIVARKGW